MADRPYDVLVVGAGLSGTAFACLLAQLQREIGSRPLRCALVSSGALEAPPNDRDGASVALSRSTVEILQHLELWSQLSESAAPIRSVLVSAAGSVGGSRLDCAAVDWDSLGHVVLISALARELVQRVRADETDLFEHSEIDGVEPLRGGGMRLRLRASSDGRVRNLETALLAIADGAESPLRQQLGISCISRDYGADALLVNAEQGGGEEGLAHEHFLPQGSLALLPLPERGQGRRALLIRAGPAAQIDRLQALPDDDLLAGFEEQLGIPALRLSNAGWRRRRVLKMILAREQYRRGLVLLGDAAHSLHPIAAQGYNLSLRDLRVLATMLVRAHAGGGALGDPQLLELYRRRRHSDQQRVRLLSDGLPRLFDAEFPFKDRLCGWGLQWLDRLGPLKQRFIRSAAGF